MDRLEPHKPRGPPEYALDFARFFWSPGYLQIDQAELRTNPKADGDTLAFGKFFFTHGDTEWTERTRTNPRGLQDA